MDRRKNAINFFGGQKPEFGNAKQIKKLNKHAAYETDFLSSLITLDSEEVTVSSVHNVSFKCPECGTYTAFITIRNENINSDWTMQNLINYEEGTCSYCGCEFVISQTGHIDITMNPIHPEKISD